MRYVCKQWYNIIHDPVFINKHLQQLRTCLLMELELEFGGNRSLACIMKKGKAAGFTYEVIRLSLKKIYYPSYDGLLVIGDLNKDSILYVLNPVTNQQVSLPAIDLSPTGSIIFCGLTKSHINEDYKVVVSCRESLDQLMILTVGKSKTWRSISTKALFTGVNEYEMFSVDGFLHWVVQNEPRYVGGFLHGVVQNEPRYVVTFEVDSETLNLSPVPEELKKGRCVFKSMGRFPSAMIEQPSNELNLDVWRLEDCRKGVWTKLYTIELLLFIFELEMYKTLFPRRKDLPFISINQRLISLQPLQWIDNGNVLILNCRLQWHGILMGSIAYNVKTGEITEIFMCKTGRLSPHVNSLVCLKSN